MIFKLFSRVRRLEKKLLRSGTEDEIVELSQRHLDRGLARRALDLVTASLERFPHSSRLQGEIRSIETRIARHHIEKIERKLPAEPSYETLLQLCKLYQRTGEENKAIDYGRRAILENPDCPKGYLEVGRIYFEEFRADQGTVEGMNALRYLTKAHGMDPQNSTCLLQLAEIFLILHAPTAALRFLRPVQVAFPDDPQVQSLVARAQQLPPEETTQIQDLMVWHEERLNGVRTTAQHHVTLPQEVIDAVQELVDHNEKVRGAFLVDSSRTAAAAASRVEMDDSQVGETFGLLAQTARQNSSRMGIGRFQELRIMNTGCNLVMKIAGESMTAFVVGERALKIEEAEKLANRLCELSNQLPTKVAP